MRVCSVHGRPRNLSVAFFFSGLAKERRAEPISGRFDRVLQAGRADARLHPLPARSACERELSRPPRRDAICRPASGETRSGCLRMPGPIHSLTYFTCKLEMGSGDEAKHHTGNRTAPFEAGAVLRAQQGTSVSAMLASELRRIVETHEEYAEAKSRALAQLDSPFQLGGRGIRNREDLHDRHDLR
jgi:hypothetical protein